MHKEYEILDKETKIVGVFVRWLATTDNILA